MSPINRGISMGPPRFMVAVHALAWLTQSGGVLTSSNIATQVNSHATFLRRVLQTLVHAGLVLAREGRDGGYMLARAANQITLADVYVAVKNECAAAAEKAVNECTAAAGEKVDNECMAAAIEKAVDCGEAGNQLDAVLEKLLSDAEQQSIEYLRQFTIADVIDRVDYFCK